jgi:hypothetical protein
MDVVAMDSPNGDAGPGDSGPTDGGPVCGPYKYCDDFESYTPGMLKSGTKLGPWAVTVSAMGVTMQVDTVLPYKSNQSLHITTPAGNSVQAILSQMASGGLVPGNDLYGRAMVYYSNAKAPGDAGNYDLAIGVHSWLFNATGNSQIADGGVTMNMGGGGAKMQLNYHPPPPLTEQSVDNGNITAGAWHCVQWQYDGSGNPPADNGNVWVDGSLALNSPKSKGWNYATPWTAMDFGFTHYQTTTNDIDLYLDDVAVDGAMVPCPP